MKKIFLSLFLFSSFNFFGQKQPSDFWNHVQFGSGINLNFSNQYTNIGVAPSVIYNFTDQFSSGVSVSYMYVKNKNVPDALHVYGTSVLAIYKPIEELQISGEFEENFLKQASVKKTIPALYLGLGYSVNRNIGMGLRYDVLYDKNKALYPSAFTPFVRVYF